MPKLRGKSKATTNESDRLKGWRQIAEFLGQPTSVAQRWSKSGMPVSREGRSVYASTADLNRWLGRESAGEPVQIVTENTDLSSELKRGLSFLRRHKRSHATKNKAA